MKITTLKFAALLTGVVFLLASCMDLDVDNPNNPDTERALASASDVEALVGSQYQQWWNIQKNYPAMTLSVIANSGTASWGNFGMMDLGQIPRQAFINDPSYADRFMSSTPWSNAFTAISSANDGLNALEAGIQFDSDHEMRAHRMETFSRFIQGISYGVLANHFDKAFLVDESIDLERVALGELELEFSPYEDVLDFAIGFLDEAIALANAGSWTLPSGWIRGNALTNAELAQLAKAYKVRFITSNARSPQERDAINWAEIRDLTADVIGADFFNNSDNAFNVDGDGDFWWSRPHSLQQDPTWHRVDMTLAGRMDQSGQFDEWIGHADKTQRRQFTATTPDARIAGQEGEGAMTTAPGTDIMEVGSAAFPPDRGLYFFSRYQAHRNNEMYLNGFVGPMQHMRQVEMTMLRAEALLRLNQPVVLPEVVDLINETRVGRGQLDPVTVADSWNDVFNAMRYEFEIETLFTAAGLDYYQTRGWGNLQGENWGALITNSPIHFPVPAGELDLLELEYYTFGGGGEGSAPRTNSAIQNAINAGNQLNVSKQ